MRVDLKFQKYNVKEKKKNKNERGKKKKQSHNNYTKYIYEVCF